MARRVNMKFLVILTVALAVIAIAALWAQRRMNKGDPKVFLANAEKYMQEKNYDAAIGNFRQALSLSPNNPEMFVKYGDFMASLAWRDLENLRQSYAAYRKALEIDPDNLAALRRTLDYSVESVKLQGSVTPELYKQIKDTASRIARLDPNDKTAAGQGHIATINAWIQGIAMERARVDESIQALSDLSLKDPANSDYPAALARAKLFVDQTSKELLSREEIRQRAVNAESEMKRALRNNQQENPGMLLRAAQVWAMIGGFDVDPSDPNGYLQRRYVPQIRQSIEEAQKLAKPDDPLYVDIILTAHQFAMQTGDMNRADTLMRELYAARPDDLTVRLAYGQYLSKFANRRDEAIGILSKEIPSDNEKYAGVNALRFKDLELKTKLALLSCRVEKAADTSDPAERAKQVGELVDMPAQLEREAGGESYLTLRLRGKIAMLQQHNVEAIQLFTKARSMHDQVKSMRDPEYWDMVFQMARVNLLARQTGQAKTLLEEIIRNFPNFSQARLLLAQLLVRENQFAAAKQHIDAASQLMPGSPEVLKLRMAMLDAEKDVVQRQSLYGQLPEDTVEQRLNKAQIALAIVQYDDAERLLKLVLDQEPSPERYVLYIKALLGQKKVDQAQKSLDEAMARYPGNGDLKIASLSVREANSTDVSALRREVIEQETDPFKRAMLSFRLEMSEKHDDEALKHLREAQKLKPEDPDMGEALFSYCCTHNMFDEARQVAQWLSKGNYDQASGRLYDFRLAMARKEFQEAIRIGRELTKTLPEFAASWLSLGQALQSSGQYEEALQKYLQALQKQSMNVQAMKGAIYCYYQLKQPNEALAYIRTGRQMFPDDVDLRDFENSYEIRFGDPQLAAGRLEQDAKDHPDDPQKLASVAGAYVQIAQRQKTRAEAEPWIRKARDIFTQGMQKWPDELSFYKWLADAEQFVGNPTEGEKVLLQLQEREAFKNRSDAKLALADFYGHIGNYDKAIAGYRQIMDKDGKTPELQEKLATLLSAQRKYDDALAVLNEANTDDPRLHRLKIQTLASAGRANEARDVLLKDLEKSPNSPDVLLQLTDIHLKLGEFDKALTALDKVLQLDPSNPAGLYLRGRVHLETPLADVDLAIRDLTELRDLLPGSIDVRKLLASAYRRKNDSDSAIRELSAALATDPLDVQVRQQLVDLCAVSRPPRWSDADRFISDAKANSLLGKDPAWWLMSATLWVQRGNSEYAINDAKTAVQMSNADSRVVQRYLDILLQTRSYKLLLDTTDKMLAGKPVETDLWWIYLDRGIAKARLDDKAGASGEFDKAAALAQQGQLERVVTALAAEVGGDTALKYIGDRDLNDPHWRLVKAIVYNTTKDRANALATLDSLIPDLAKLPPGEQLTALRFAGPLYSTARPQPEVDKAIDVYNRILQMVPNDISALNNLAYVLVEQVKPPRYQQALSYSQKAFDLTRSSGIVDPYIYDTHAWALSQANPQNTDDAIDILQTVTAKQGIPEAHYHLAELMLKKGRPEEAQRHLEHANALIQEKKKRNEFVDLDLEAKIADAQSRITQKLNTGPNQAQTQ